SRMHRRLEIMRLDALRGATPGREGGRWHSGRLGLDALIEHGLGIQVPAPGQHQYKDPALARLARARIEGQPGVEQAGTLTLIGAPGWGKTTLAICVATKQVQLGYTTCFLTAQAFASRIGCAATSLGRQRVLKPLLACGVLVCDELGYVPSDTAARIVD